MYQAVMDGLYQKVAEFATTKTDQKQNFSLNLNFKSPYVALPKAEISNFSWFEVSFLAIIIYISESFRQFLNLNQYLQSNEFLFGQLGKISIENAGGSLEHFSIGIEQAAVSSLIKHGIEKMEDRGEILNGTDLNVRLALGNSLDVDVEFDSEPVLMVTKQAYEQILKSLDNIALPNDNSNETKIESEESIVEKKEFKAIRAALHLHGLTIDMRDESNKPTVKVIFSDLKLDFDKQTEDCFTTNLILGGLEAIDSLESPESHMLRSRKPERRLRKSSSWPRCLNNPKEYIRHKRLSSYGVSMPQKSSQALSSPVGLMRTHSFISRTRPKLKSHQKPENDASLVKIFIKQKNPPNRTGEREIKIKFSELEAGVNLQTWVMLLDFLTPSSASLQVIIDLLKSVTILRWLLF